MSRKYTCCVPGCRIQSTDPVAFTCTNLRAEWLRVLCLSETDLNSVSKVCRCHFLPTDFANKKPLGGIVPSKNLPVRHFLFSRETQA